MNQTSEKLVVGGAIAGGLLFFGFLSNTCSSPFSKHTNSDTTTTSITSSRGSHATDEGHHTQTDLNKLRQTISSQQKNIELKAKEIADLQQNLETQKAQANALTTEHTSLKQELAKLQHEYNNELTYLKNQVTNSGSTNTTNPATAAAGDLDALQKKYQLELGMLKSSIQLKESEITSKSAEINELLNKFNAQKQTSTELDAKLKKLTLEFANSKEAHQNELEKLKFQVANAGKDAAQATDKQSNLLAELKTQLSGKDAEIKTLNTQLTQFKAQLTNAGNGDGAQATAIAGLKNQLVEKEAEIKTLNAQVNQLKAQKNSFVKSADGLPKNAQALLADIKALEGKSAKQTQAAYPGIETKHNATSVARIKFHTGSSKVADAYKAKIKELTASSDDNTYFLITGFADKTGNAADNKRLSSKRATAVAKELSAQAKGYQAAQAVYLGQTDRFGPASENRVVEIWKIK